MSILYPHSWTRQWNDGRVVLFINSPYFIIYVAHACVKLICCQHNKCVVLKASSETSWNHFVKFDSRCNFTAFICDNYLIMCSQFIKCRVIFCCKPKQGARKGLSLSEILWAYLKMWQTCGASYILQTCSYELVVSLVFLQGRLYKVKWIIC